MCKNNEIKVIISDLDGTLTNSDKHVLPYTKDIIHKAINQGCHLVLATGRPLFGVTRVIEELELKKYGGYVVSYNGALISEIKTGEVIYEQKIPESLVIPIYEFISSIPEVHIATYQPGYIYSETIGDQYLEIEGFGCSTAITVVDYLPDMIKDGMFKYVITGDPQLLPGVRVQIEDRFGDRVSTIISEPFFLEVVPKGIHKAASLETLMNYLHYDRSQSMAFGDGRNDVEMLKFAGLSFAMQNGCQEAKKAANFITGSNDEDGVGKAIEQFVLK